MSFSRDGVRLLVGVGLLGTLAACPPPPPKDRCQNIYPQVMLAAQKAALKIESKYHACVPTTYGPGTFLADLQSSGLGDEDLKALQSVSLDVWTDVDCDGYVLVARCNLSKDVMFWDRSNSTSYIDGPGPDGRIPAAPVPAHAPPASCTCK